MVCVPSLPFRSGFVALVGKPNVGKSTLLNAYLGKKVSIVSNKPQTTRQRILGILTRPDAQIIFIDSPGWHKPEHPLGKYMVSVAKGIIGEGDVLVMLLDAAQGFQREDEWVVEQVRAAKRPALLAINKVDRVNKGKLLPLIEEAVSRKLFEEIIPISATTQVQLDVLLKEMLKRLPEGPRWYQEGQVTDQSTELIIREFIREAALQATRQEVPHAVAVSVDHVEQKERATVIRATIFVEREGQKGILIGKKGQMLKQIGTAARQEIERWLSQRVFLELWVKVASDWRDNPSRLRDLGYTHEPK
ncbi:MAG: GTPase Era [Candidatus Omnitrophica bacterium]|nr:GTPase Era [Candidatus Omnitrophota bacterium]